MHFTDEAQLQRALLDTLAAGFDDLPEVPADRIDDPGRAVLLELAERLQDNLPYFHPLYAGQMLKPPHPLAREAYALAMRINPNNHALDGGRATSLMEQEAVAELARMVGWPQHLGHLTGGGTLANLEALWVARELHPDQIIVGSAHAHYTHARISSVLGIDYRPVAVDSAGRMDPAALEALMATESVGTVVATLGTTGLGAVDPLDEILGLARTHGARVHADAAYGGYFRLSGALGAPAAEALACLTDVDSVVIDPHKHGLQPYGCGCVLFRDPTVGRFYRHDSPYTYFTSDELHLGEISLECSRSGAAAAALWATQRYLPLERDGTFAHGLDAGRSAALELHARLAGDGRFLTLDPPDLDIVVFAPRAASGEAISVLSSAVFDEALARDLHLALISLEPEFLAARWASVEPTGGRLTCLRCCLMKPDHSDWLDAIWERLNGALDAALAGAD